MALQAVPIGANLAKTIAAGTGAAAGAGGIGSGVLGALGLSNPLGWAALAASAILPGLFSGPKHVPVPAYTASPEAGNIDLEALAQQRPDVLQEYQNLLTRDSKSRTMLQELGIDNPQEFEQYWYDKHGKNEGYVAPTLASQTPTTGGGGTVTPADPVGATPTTPVDDGSKGVNDSISQLLQMFTQQQSQAAAQDQARQNNRNAVMTQLGTGYQKIGSGTLDQTITDLLTKGYADATSQLDRGKARGIYNDVGYTAGLDKLGAQRTAKEASLRATANDILNNYRTKYDTLENNALSAADVSNSSFDLSPYLSQANDIVTQANTNASGDFLSQIGDGPLFDLSPARSAAGTAQGALNLKNLDVLDAISKRKAANSVGRGLGSQGSF